MKNLLLKFASFLIVRLKVSEIYWNKKKKNHLVTVLCLHRVSDEQSLSWPPLPIKTFEHLCKYWASHYHSTTFSSLKEDVNVTKPLLILSFDDGYADFYQNVWPLLKLYGLKANMNIVTSCASLGMKIWTQRLNNAIDSLWEKGITKSIRLKNGSRINKAITKVQLVKECQKLFQYLCTIEMKDRQLILDDMIEDFGIQDIHTPLMDWNQIIELSKEGVEIGSHTKTHDILTTILDTTQLYEEVVMSKSIIEDKIGKEVRTLAFPNGYSTEETRRIALESGYEFLLTVNSDLFSIETFNELQIFPRILIYRVGYYENILATENIF